jgi:hypothetical protein
MVRALGPEILQKKKGLENLERVEKASAETVHGVENGCPTHWTLLHFVLELLILKAKYGWSDCSFNNLLCLLSWLLPQPNSVPANTYQAKKVISPLTMGVEKIHVCPNHCILFRDQMFGELDTCPRCGASRYKNNDLYNGGEASTGNKRNNKWKDFDVSHKDFSQDPKNVRFSLSTDGMNPFNERMSDHNTWASDPDHVQHPNILVSEENIPFPHCSCFWP